MTKWDPGTNDPQEDFEGVMAAAEIVEVVDEEEDHEEVVAHLVIEMEAPDLGKY